MFKKLSSFLLVLFLVTNVSAATTTKNNKARKRVSLPIQTSLIVDGKTGKILKIHPKDNKVTVDGINIVKKHVKPTKDAPGSIQEIVKPMDVSKVAYYDQDTKGASKIEFKFDKDGKKIRIAKKSGKEIK